MTIKKSLILGLFLSPLSIAAPNYCQLIHILPAPVSTVTDPQDVCKPESDTDKNSIVVRSNVFHNKEADAFSTKNNFDEATNYEVDQNKWCGPGGHFYVSGNGTIIQGRPENIKGANEVGNGYVNTKKLGIRVFDTPNPNELSPAFVGNFTNLILCKMQQYQIKSEAIKTHYISNFKPIASVTELLKSILEQADAQQEDDL